MATTEWYHSEYTCHQIHGCRQDGRLFDDDDYSWEEEIEHDNDPWTYLSCPHDTELDYDYEEEQLIAHRDSIVISVDGACRNNGYSNAYSGIGVFVHKHSSLNMAAVIGTQNHTSQRAELHAGLKGLQIAKEVRNQNPRKGDPNINAPGPYRKLRRVVIKADSRYLVDAMTDWIFKWQGNGYTNAKGLPVVNQDLFPRLEEAVDELEALGVEVQFWHVGRGNNGVADCLANAALDGQDADGAVEEYFEYM